MKEIIKEYTDALQENITASKEENAAKDRKKKAYHRLILARDNLRNYERELLEGTLVLN